MPLTAFGDFTNLPTTTSAINMSTITVTQDGNVVLHEVEYCQDVIEQLRYLENTYLEAIARWLDMTRLDGRTVFVLGNGGSYANASHLVLHLRDAGIKAVDLLADTSQLTALSNDGDYATAPRDRLTMEADSKDMLVVISGSGESANILLALAAANRIGMSTVGLLGFGGGAAKKLCDLAVVLPSKNYGVVEDCHSVVLHILAGLVKDPTHPLS
jgi:D-sedoheptulose 7-phosphate isomerase